VGFPSAAKAESDIAKTTSRVILALLTLRKILFEKNETITNPAHAFIYKINELRQ
jgi:hypothetical protein